jgi:hypothetical protein
MAFRPEWNGPDRVRELMHGSSVFIEPIRVANRVGIRYLARGWNIDEGHLPPQFVYELGRVVSDGGCLSYEKKD